MTTISTGAPRRSAPRGVRERGRDPSVYAASARACRRRGAELELAAVVEPEQLVGVAVLLVVVDQARVRRRRDDPVEARAVVDLARVAVDDARLAPARAHARERLDPRERVERVAAQEAARRLDRAARRACACSTSTRSLCGARGNSRSKCVVRRAERAARERMTRSTSACS